MRPVLGTLAGMAVMFGPAVVLAWLAVRGERRSVAAGIPSERAEPETES